MLAKEKALVFHRLRSVCGHLDAVGRMIETGKPCEQILHQLGAIKAALHEIGLVILEKEMLRSKEIILTNKYYEERLIAARRILAFTNCYTNNPI